MRPSGPAEPYSTSTEPRTCGRAGPGVTRALTGSAVGEFGALVEDLGPWRGDLGQGLRRSGAEDGGAMTVLEGKADAAVALDGAAHSGARHHPPALVSGRLR